MSFTKIPGPALCGFADLFEEPRALNLIGAGKKNPKKTGGAPPSKKAPLKGDEYKKKAGIKPSKTQGEHAKTVNEARKSARVVFAKLKKAAKVLVRKDPKLKPSGRVTVRRGRPGSVSVRGDGIYAWEDVVVGYDEGNQHVPDNDYVVVGMDYVVVGKGPDKVTKKLTPKVKNALAKLEKARKKSKDAAGKLKKSATEAKDKLSHLTKSIKNQRVIARGIRKTAVAVRGEILGYDPEAFYRRDDGVFGQYDDGFYRRNDMLGYEYLGEDEDITPLDEDDAGADAGTVDDLDTGTDTKADPAGLDTGGPLSPEDLATLGPAPGFDFTPADYKAVGGIPYDFSKGKPAGFLISKGLADGSTMSQAGSAKLAVLFKDKQIPFMELGTKEAMGGLEAFGYVFGGKPGDGGWPGDDANQWVHVHGRHGFRDWWENVGGWDQTAQIVAASLATNAPNGNAYGPIIGNPAMADFKTLRVDKNGVAFWYPQEAPDWVMAPLRQAAQLTKLAKEKAEKAAADAEAKAKAKELADQEAAKAAQEAAQALAESQAESERKQAESQAAGQTAQAQAAQAQADTEWQQQSGQQDIAERQHALEVQKQQLAERQAYYSQPAPQEVEAQVIDEPYDSPEAAEEYAETPAATEAQAIDESGDPDGLEGVLGDLLAGDDIVGEIVGGDGEAIGIDQYGNAVD